MKKLNPEEHISLLLSDARGVYIPANFFECFDYKLWGLSEEDMLTNPEEEYYWEGWERVLDKARYVDDNGVTWLLYQNGDLYSVTEEFMYSEEFEEWSNF